VGEFAERWLRDFKRPRASTNSHNRRMVRPIVAELGRERLSSVTRRQAREFALRHKSNVPTARAMWNDAIDDEAGPTSNPFAALRLQRSKGRSGITALTEAEMLALCTRARDLFGEYGKHVAATIAFAAYVGCRPGEMFALTWGDVDPVRNGGEVRVSKTIAAGGETTPPKNGLERTVVLPPKAWAAVLEGCEQGDPGDLVFRAARGARFSRTSHLHYWDRVRKADGRPTMQFYELRHFAATYLLELGLSPADVAVQLGHTDGGALVMSTYGHPEQERARERVRAAMQARQTTE
jgi:integrase